MLKDTLLKHKKIIEYSVYLLIMLNILDVFTTYVGIKYFNAYEANGNTAYLFDLFGLVLSSSLKILLVLILGYIIINIRARSEIMTSNKCIWMNYIGILANFNIIVIILSLNLVYLLVFINNVGVILLLTQSQF